MMSSSFGSLERVRAEIARVDSDLVTLIAERVRLAREASQAKRAAGLPIRDPEQEAAVVRRAAVLAREAGLPAEEVRDLFWQLIAIAWRVQTDETPASAT